MRLWDAIVSIEEKKTGFKITAVFEGIHLFKHLGKTGCHIILTNKNMLCQLHAVPQTF